MAGYWQNGTNGEINRESKTNFVILTSQKLIGYFKMKEETRAILRRITAAGYDPVTDTSNAEERLLGTLCFVIHHISWDEFISCSAALYYGVFPAWEYHFCVLLHQVGLHDVACSLSDED